MDRLTPLQRHRNMAAIKGKDTKPEMVVRRYLWSMGFRYRLNHKRLPGKPDIVLRRYRTCIFVNGCFWHGHKVVVQEGSNAALVQESSNAALVQESSNAALVQSSDCCKIPKSNTSFWVEKIMRNKERDKMTQQQLAEMGWHCITIWECELKPERREQTLESLAFTLNNIYLQDRTITYAPPEQEHMIAAEGELTGTGTLTGTGSLFLAKTKDNE